MPKRSARRRSARRCGSSRARARRLRPRWRSVRDLLVRQRTQLINALRVHLTEFGYIVRQGAGHVSKLIEIVDDSTSGMPAEARLELAVIAESLQALHEQIALLDRGIASRAKADPWRSG